MLMAVCRCLDKVYCVCKGFLSSSREIVISEEDLQEWKRIEGIDQFARKRK